MGDIGESLRRGEDVDRQPPRPLGILDAARLQAYGYAIAIIYAGFFVTVYINGVWLIDHSGSPIYTDFTTTWVVGFQAAHGDPSLLYNSADFLKIQAAVIGPRDFLYPNWPYPPTFFLILAPLSMLPYAYAFLTWDVATLLCLIIVVYLIVRRVPAVAVALASPFTAWNFLAGQNGFLTASLLGASLLLLDRKPVLAGLFIGCFAFKPQFAILFPLALAASGRWRAFASAAAATALFVSASIIAFGAAAWEAFPRGLGTQFSVVLEAGGHPDDAAPAEWGLIQSTYGLVRYLHGGAALAWIAQGATIAAVVIIVCCVWRSAMRYSLKAATLSAAALLATPYAFAYDMAALAIPVAFLARDQLSHGLLRGEQTALIAMFGALLAALLALGDRANGVTFGSLPLGPVVVITLLALSLRRGWYDTRLAHQHS
jgi:hypothetical protein